jgi:hypothetical protein
MPRPETQDDVLAELRRRLGRDLDETVVGYMRSLSDALEDLRADVSLDEAMAALMDDYRDLSRLGTGPASKRRRRSIQERATDERTLALSEIFAIDAARDLRVVEFRRVVLKNRLLSRDEVPGWVQSKRSEVRGPAHWGRVRISRAGRVLERSTRSSSVDMLAYIGPDSPWPLVIVLPGRGALRSLKDLAEPLANRYGWTEGQASTFVLTGSPPLLGARATVWQRSSWTAAGTIVLELPITTKPREVSGLYQRVSAGAIDGRRRWRDLSAAHAELAVFAFGHNDGRSWREVMEAWNQEHGAQRQYEGVRQFSKACREAFHAVTDENLEWRGRAGAVNPRASF